MSRSIDSRFREFDITAQTFKTSADSAQLLLQSMLEAVKNGSVPRNEDVDALTGAVQTLRAGYDDLYSRARDILEESVPARGCPLGVLSEAVRLQRERLQYRLREAEVCLDAFLSVEAVSAMYLEALDEPRMAASRLLAQLRGNTASLETLDSDLHPFRLFLRALDLGEESLKGSDELLEELDLYFSPKTVRSLAWERYRRGSAPATAPEESEFPSAVDVKPAPAASAPVDLAEKPAPAEASAPAVKPAETAPESPAAPAGKPVSKHAVVLAGTLANALAKTLTAPAEDREFPNAVVVKPASAKKAAAEKPVTPVPAEAPAPALKPAETAPESPAAPAGKPASKHAVVLAGTLANALAKTLAAPNEDREFPNAVVVKPASAKKFDAENPAAPAATVVTPASEPAVTPAAPAPAEAPAPAVKPVAPTIDESASVLADALAGALDASAEEVYVQPDEGELIDIAARVFDRNAETFIEKKIKSDHEYRVFFRILATFCIITEEQLSDFAQLCGLIGKKTASKLGTACSLLTSKGYVRKVKAPVEALTLPSFEHAALVKHLKKCSIELNLSVPEQKTYEAKTREGTIRLVLAQNACLIRYLKALKTTDADRFLRAFESVKLYGCRQKVAAFWQSESHPCYIALPGQDLSAAKDWLFVPAARLPELHDVPEDTSCFAFLDGVTYRWEGAWKPEDGAEIPASPVAAESAPAPESSAAPDAALDKVEGVLLAEATAPAEVLATETEACADEAAEDSCDDAPDLAARKAELLVALDKAEQKCLLLAEKLKMAENVHKKAKADLNAGQGQSFGQLMKIREKARDSQADRDAAKQALHKAQNDKSLIEDELAEVERKRLKTAELGQEDRPAIEAEIARLEKMLARLDLTLTTKASEVEAAENKCAPLAKRLTQAAEALNKAKAEQRGAKELSEKFAKAQQTKKAEADRDDIQQALDEARKAKADIEAELAALEEERLEAQTEKQRLEDELARLERERIEADPELREQARLAAEKAEQERLAAERAAQEKARREAEEAERKRIEAEMAAEELRKADEARRASEQAAQEEDAPEAEADKSDESAAEQADDGESLRIEAAEPVEVEAVAPFIAPSLPRCPDELLSSEGEDIAQAAARLARHTTKPSDLEFYSLISRLLREGSGRSHIAQALLLAQAASIGRRGELPLCEYIHNQLKTALGPISGVSGIEAMGDSYAGYRLIELFSGDSPQSLVLAACMHAMFAPGYKDYGRHTQMVTFLKDYENHFPDYAGQRDIFALLCEIHDTEPCGFTPAILRQLEGEDSKKEAMEGLQDRAKKLACEPSIKTYMNGLDVLKKQQFGVQSDLYRAMEIISLNDSSQREFVDLLIADFCRKVDDSYVIDEKELEAAIDSAWGTATKGLSTHRVPLKLMARRQIRQAFVDRIELMREWLESAAPIDHKKLDAMRRLKARILQELDRTFSPSGSSDCFGHYPCVVSHALDRLRTQLQQEESSRLFTDLLRTGLISLDDRFQPVFYEGTEHVPYYEPWRLALLHIALPNMTEELARDAICNAPDSLLFDNLQQLKMIDRSDDTEDEAKAVESAKERAAEFMVSLELDYAVGRVSEQDKEDLCELISNYREEFFATKDFGCWKRFIEALQHQKEDKVERMRLDLKKEIAMRRVSLNEEALHSAETEEQSSLKKQAALLDDAEAYLDDGQFTMAEENLNLFDSPDTNYEEELKSIRADDEHSRFMESFDLLYEEAKRERPLRSLSTFLDRRYPADWTERHKKDSSRIIDHWPLRKGSPTTGDILELVKALGIDARSAEKCAGKEDVFRLEVKPQPRRLNAYSHPIPEFGTKLRSPLSVVALYGSHLPSELITDISSLNTLNPNGTAIVLLNYAMHKDQRPLLAELCHKHSDVRFIVIDRVLALHLALHEQSKRLSVLLSCTLPYAAAPQPFVDGAGETSDEMFFGRRRELQSIRDLNGATLVYGGRQLGKTALLQRAQSLTHMPENRDFAVFCNIEKMTDERSAVENIAKEINKETPLALGPCTSLAELCDQLEDRFREGRIQALLLLIDEADAFLRSIAEKAYEPLYPLINLKRRRQFKFVLAGLNNVYRTRKATTENHDFGQLGQPLCIKPFSPDIALRLVTQPLRYLGFQFTEDDDRLKAILSSTNYYPGILHLFGYSLVQLLNEKYAHYFRAADGNPPFKFRQGLLSAAAAKLNESVKDRFQRSLDMDKRYNMLAKCIGMLYYCEQDMHDSYKGYSVETIRKLAEDYGISCLAGLTSDEYEALLDEMAAMGILHSSAPRVYRLRKRSLLSIIGPDMDSLDKTLSGKN